jgi:uncharacterized phage protein (TIGR01671 family)
MNREIKFRYYDKQEQKVYSMNTGDMLSVVCGSIAAVHIQGDYTLDVPEEIILLQFTGLKDKNGKEIYEGDILKYSDNYPEFTGFVKYDNRFGMFTIEIEFNNQYNFLHHKMSPDLEVIGNIYENPELLEKNNE